MASTYNFSRGQIQQYYKMQLEMPMYYNTEMATDGVTERQVGYHYRSRNDPAGVPVIRFATSTSLRDVIIQ